MDPYCLHYLYGSQASGDGRAQTTQCIGHDSRFYSSLLGSESQHLPTGSLQRYPLFVHDGHGSSPFPRTPWSNTVPSFRPPVGSGFGRAPPSTSNHRNHSTDRASDRHQEWIQLPIPTVPAPTPLSGTALPYASTRCLGSSQPCLVKAIPPDPLCDSPLQADTGGPDTDENISSSTGGFTFPEQTFPSMRRTPASPSYAPADPADIEYAQHRYGNKRCFYRCRFDISGSPCNKWIVGDRTRVLRHLRDHHHLQTGPAVPALCCWEQCTHSRPMKQENLSRHVVMHLGVKWKCPHCSRLFSRDDAVHRHMERMAPGVDATEAEVVPGREARTITLTDSRYKRARVA